MASTIRYSAYQKNIFEFVKNGSGSAVVEAKAGSSKTTTLIKSLEGLPHGARVLLLAFNVHIAKELSEKAPLTVKSSTINSIGNSLLTLKYGNAVRKGLNNYKVKNVVDKMIESGDLSKEYYSINWKAINETIKMARVEGLIPDKYLKNGYKPVLSDTVENWKQVILDYDIEVGGESFLTTEMIEMKTLSFIETCREILGKCIESKEHFDFTDQIYLPVVNRTRSVKYDYIFIDEAQDLNSTQIEMIKLLAKPETRVFAFGDRDQSLYAFNGSRSDAMAYVGKTFNCISMPLSISYRCSKAVIKEAQKIVPEIEVFEKAQEGRVESIDSFPVSSFQPGDVCLCRYNAPLVSLYYKTMKKKIPVAIRGNEIGKGLVATVKKLSGRDSGEIFDSLVDWKEDEINKKLKKNPGANLSSIEDKYDCIKTFIDNSPSGKIAEIVCEIEKTFKDTDQKGLVELMTIHKSKGLEWGTVYILDFHNMPSKYAKLPEDLKQEQNCKYVAITRSKRDLFFITSRGSY